MPELLPWDDATVLAEKARLIRAVAKIYQDAHPCISWNEDCSTWIVLAPERGDDMCSSVFDLFGYLDTTTRPTGFYKSDNQDFRVKPSGQFVRRFFWQITSMEARLHLSFYVSFLFTKEEFDQALTAEGQFDPEFLCYDLAHAEPPYDLEIEYLDENDTWQALR